MRDTRWAVVDLHARRIDGPYARKRDARKAAAGFRRTRPSDMFLERSTNIGVVPWKEAVDTWFDYDRTCERARTGYVRHGCKATVRRVRARRGVTRTV